MKKIIWLFITVVFTSCIKQDDTPVETCPGGCDGSFTVTTGELQSDGYWHVPFLGYNYFTIKGELTELSPEYEINNVPLIETAFDSDYWITVDTIRFTTPMYSYLGWFSDNNFQNPIPIGNNEYNIIYLANEYTPYNIAGYQLNPNICWDCPYTETLFGSYSKYTYIPSQNIFFDNEMIGDTANIFIRVTFNTDLGPREVKNETLKIIFE
jgi:hypothetical protein